ncbi:MAG: tRNA (N(6)-L-threonylcarbamoyladenosine(37)-C(2))-methylthiotransferase MtaB [Solobacterium sp.]|nr:tRNA (N(6)-L-threonylcarbamoyladenosine(37)-C(2))-methylthiotransferase MtaB [Solobacterium sp.]
MKCSLINLGCKVNAYETESIGRMLEEEGYERVEVGEPSDVTVIFTCAVTNTAAAKSRKMIHRARRMNPDGVICVAGCYAQIEPEVLEDADVLVGSAHKRMIPEYIRQFQETHIPVRDLSDPSADGFETLLTDRFADRTRAFLKIQDGCNQFCTYCIIPFARGRERSMAPDTVIEEIRRISASHSEVVLAGIHTGRYGKEYGITLTQLMERILKEVPELQRLRISSIEVTELSGEFLDLMEREPRIARHLHIPLQSGSDMVLKRMGRPYTTADYLKRIQEIRQRIPDISISTDLMVGFPGESEEAFEEVLAFVRRCEFSFLHVFPFSLRKGTAAEHLDGHVDPQVKKQRAARCIELSNELKERYIQSMLGKEVVILTETETSGYTGEYLEAVLSSPMAKGRMVKAVLTSYNNGILEAEGSGYLETE